MTMIEKIRAEIAKIRDSWEKDCYHDEADALTLAVQIIDKYAEQEPCDAAISRDFQIGDEVRIIGSDPIYDDCDVGWVIRNASEKVKTMYVMRNDGSAGEENKAEWYKTGRHNAMLAEVIKALPSVRPQEPKTGHWIALDNRLDFGVRVKCSECGQVFITGDEISRNYCPNCGCRMFETQESEDKG